MIMVELWTCFANKNLGINGGSVHNGGDGRYSDRDCGGIDGSGNNNRYDRKGY